MIVPAGLAAGLVLAVPPTGGTVPTSGGGNGITVSITPEYPPCLASPCVITLYAEVRGGEPPYVYVWTLGDGSAAFGQGVSHSFPTCGVYPVSVWVMVILASGTTAPVES